MKLNMPMKILIGILTGISVLFPFLIVPGVIMLMIIAGVPFLESQSAPEYFIVMMTMIFFISMICFSFLQLALQVTYMVHEVLNKTLTDTFRVLFIVGTFFLPFIAMPIYFVAYMWKDNPPELEIEKE